MDSLFDASLFDASAFEAPGEPDPDGTEPPTDTLGAPLVTADEVVPEDEPIAQEAPPPPSEADDPGDVLNDPAWDPPVDVPLDQRGESADRLWADVVGQSAAVGQLRGSTLTPVHAYLFEGPPGSGKRVAAAAFGAALLCPRGGCGVCDLCVRVRSEVHPDLVVVEREGASISVDQAREIIRLAVRSPIEGDRKVLVLVDFHLGSNAGPTLLKIIEEPPESTVFVILADHVTNELVTIASRCVRVPFVALPLATVIAGLVADGIDPSRAEQAARAAGGRLDRARLLATDPELGDRQSFWVTIARRLDGTGAAASVVAAEAMAMLDRAAVGPLETRQAIEIAVLDERLKAQGTRGGAGPRKELIERHKRELKRLRDDELRFGLVTLQRSYRDAAVSSAVDGVVWESLAAVRRIDAVHAEFDRNPNVGLLLQALLLALPGLRASS